MNHPKVYDAKGRVLEVDSPVVAAQSDSYNGQVTELAWTAGQGWKVHVHWAAADITFWASYCTSPDVEPDSYRCTDLLLITDKEKGDGDGDS